MEPVYVKRFIKSADDLPKDGQYIAHYKRYADDSPAGIVLSYISSFDTDQLRNWLNHIDWYLEPVEIPTKDDANDFAAKIDISGSEYRGFQKCYNWLFSRLK